jgi:hypothetical protein
MFLKFLKTTKLFKEFMSIELKVHIFVVFRNFKNSPMNIPDIIICSPEENEDVNHRTTGSFPISIPSTPSFRMKGARYSLLYQGHLPKQEYHDWFLRSVLPKKQGIDTTIFIGHIPSQDFISSDGIRSRFQKMTRVIFKLNNYNIDWKSPVKFNYKLGDAIYRPEIKVIYKTQFHKEYNALIQQDPYTYPSLSNPNIVSIRSPKRYKMIPLTPVVHIPYEIEPPPQPLSSLPEPLSSLPEPLSSSQSPPPPTSTVPEPSVLMSNDILELLILNKIKTILEDMGIMKILALAEAKAEVKVLQMPIPESSPMSIPIPPPLILYGIYIEGEACDFLDSSSYSYILENKSIVSIKPIGISNSKKPIFTTKSDFSMIKEILEKYDLWFHECNRIINRKLLPLPGQDFDISQKNIPEIQTPNLILKNTDLMILGLKL